MRSLLPLVSVISLLLVSPIGLNARSLTDLIPPSPFGENILYSEQPRLFCEELDARMKNSRASDHPSIRDKDFIEDVCLESPWLEEIEDFCDAGNNDKRRESCRRNFFWTMVAYSQCDDWVSFGASSTDKCSRELSIAYIDRAFYFEGISDTANQVATPLATQLEELIGQIGEDFQEGFDLANGETLRIIEKWTAQEKQFIAEWEKLVDERDKIYELAVALEQDNVNLRKSFQETVDAYDAEMEKGRQSLDFLATQLASSRAKSLVQEAEDARRKQRQSGMALIALGAAISGGGLPTRQSYAPRYKPSLSKFKNCNYRVRGEAISLPVLRTSPCARELSWGGAQAFYTGEN